MDSNLGPSERILASYSKGPEFDSDGWWRHIGGLYIVVAQIESIASLRADVMLCGDIMKDDDVITEVWHTDRLYHDAFLLRRKFKNI